MQRILCKSKIHRATITEANLHYEGSLTVDESLMKAAGIVPYEKVSVVNINNGERFETYAIRGKAASGVICLNGAAARKGAVGDQIIIISYALFSEEEIAGYLPAIVHVNQLNHVRELEPEAVNEC